MVKPPPVIAKRFLGSTPEAVQSTQQTNAAIRRVCAEANICGTDSATADGFTRHSPEALLRAIAAGKVGIVNLEDPERKIFQHRKRRC